MLKNTSQREDYMWLLENHEMLDMLFSLISAEKVPRGIKKGKEGIPDTRETVNALIRLFAERGIKRGKSKVPSTQEMIDILTGIFEGEEATEEKAPKRIKRKKDKKTDKQATFDVFEE